MTAPSPAPLRPKSLRIGRVILIVHDLDRVSSFYQHAIGLHLISADASQALLGVGDTVLLELRRDPQARRHSPREPGLFHTAFLLPTRADLGAWLQHAVATEQRLQGASDHLVSEAIYLTDPEGNGIEIYADRPAAQWQWTNGLVTMATEPLDAPDLLASAAGITWGGFPPGATVGHVHLQVGAIAPAEEFYAGLLGLDITCRYPGATFFSSGHYHHHIAANIWNSRGASARIEPTTGIAEVEILAENAAPASLRDPWGIAVTLSP